ncbi:MAG: endonuclease III domain-containing protein [Synergistetes bacterium]|nr:MAG: Repair endonuclease [bacterium 42_11]MBC7331943.1 endonuclease III domain-containing protein [Synergistota bacterium]MDK2871107.1 endonuclease related protein [bacterium]
MKVSDLYTCLKKVYGFLGKWWPGLPEEIIIGAVLTQNTNWKNVSRAIENLKKALGENDILRKAEALSTEKLAELIRPAGFFNLKAKRLKALLAFLKAYDFDLNRLKSVPTDALRKSLLEVKGVGKETADSILLYALDKPVFVVDSYTKRLLKRLFNIDLQGYDEIKNLFESEYPPDLALYQELHGLIVEHAKRYCVKRPKCDECPLQENCYYASQLK